MWSYRIFWTHLGLSTNMHNAHYTVLWWNRPGQKETLFLYHRDHIYRNVHWSLHEHSVLAAYPPMMCYCIVFFHKCTKWSHISSILGTYPKLESHMFVGATADSTTQGRRRGGEFLWFFLAFNVLGFRHTVWWNTLHLEQFHQTSLFKTILASRGSGAPGVRMARAPILILALAFLGRKSN